MVKKMTVWVMAVLFLAGMTPALAADEGKKSPDPSKAAYEHASDKAKFKRTEDVKGKETEKAAKKADKEKRAAEKEAKKQEKKTEKAAKKMKKGPGK